MLLSAACCIPTVLLLVNMWIKILENNAKKFHGGDAVRLGEMKKANKAVSFIRKYVEVPFFTAAILAILVIGEWNLFSKQVRYQTEPVKNIGQWGPIVGTGLAVIGSLYVLLAQAMVREQLESDPPPKGEIIRRIARRMMRFSNWIGIPKQDRFDTGSDFREVRQRFYPTVPGEEHRVGQNAIDRVQSGYDQRPESSSIHSAMRSRSRSRAGSSRSAVPGTAADGEPSTPVGHARRLTLEVPSSSQDRDTARSRTYSGGSQNSTANQDPPIIRVTTMDQTTSPEMTPLQDVDSLDNIPNLPQEPVPTLQERG
ncbi:uncharacterized protein LTR77_007820 [Saxophila tyrrhenica]|uniref:Uncharacterized protein n=1 Tax=Saxophila tyrrhenica TaxID=1690608 RepID=A0AAV9P6Z9_9PEZI|nr:hypothetical protein LTR77_007820 [Saxophila tyrrhenica]